MTGNPDQNTDTGDDFARALLTWYRKSGRHDLPWQTAPTPYRVWISEIMLQQTQVQTVKPYFERWMARFPDVRLLAAASEDEVMHLWSGLGYYARARNAHRAARIICQAHEGRFPADLETLMALPGIGRSTAGAILALSMGERHAILDGNVKRVLSRFHAIEGWPGNSAVSKALWTLAEAHTPATDVAAYTQAIMDLGATTCTRRHPRCDDCPVSTNCQAHQRQIQHLLPTPKPRKERPRRQTVMAMLQDQDGKVYLQQRAAAGIWGGLWSLPEFAGLAELGEYLETAKMSAFDMQIWPDIEHGFTHYRLAIKPVSVRLAGSECGVADSTSGRWVWPARLPELGLAAPVATLLRQLAAGEPAGSDKVVKTTGVVS